MDIDECIEGHLREAFSAVIGRDGDRMVAALEGLNEQDSQVALVLGLTVCEYALREAFGDEPTESELRNEAQELVADVSDWIDLGTPELVARFLGAVAYGDTSFASLSSADVVTLTLVCGGYLLGTRRSKDQKWWQYLNEIWSEVEEEPLTDED
jgi:hypothetical protein